MIVRAASALSLRQRLGIILLVALAIRLVILTMTAQLGLQIEDEQHYHVLATSLVEGRGFATGSGPTSLRPPLYPALLASLWWVTDSRSLQIVRGVQDLIGLATAALVYFIGRRLYDERAGLWNPFTPADRDSIQSKVRAQLVKAGSEIEFLEHANRSAAELLKTLLAQDEYTVDVSIRGRPVPSGKDQ